MKLKYLKLTALFVLTALIPAPPQLGSTVVAQNTAVTVQFNASPSEACTLRILEHGKTAVNDISDIIYMDEVYTSEDGVAVFNIPDGFEEGVYGFIAKTFSGEEFIGNVNTATGAVIQSQTLNERLGGSAQQRCTLRIYKKGLTQPGTINDIIYMDEAVSDDRGNVSFVFDRQWEIGRYFYIIVSEQGETKTGYITINGTGSDTGDAEEAYYILDEDFAMLLANSGDPLDSWGWDTLESAGSLSYDTSWLKLSDTSDTGRTLIKRTFERQTTSRVYVEFRTQLDDITDGYGVGLYDGVATAAELTVQGGKLCANGEPVCDMSANTMYGVRMEFDMDEGLYDLYLNGTRVGEALEMNGAGFDNICAFTSVSGQGNMCFKPVRIMRGYYVAEEFIAYKHGLILPADGIWQADRSGGNTDIITSAGTPYPDIYSLHLNDASAQKSVSIRRSFKTLRGKETVTFKVYCAEVINKLNATFGDLCADITDGVFRVKDPYGAWQEIKALPQNLWNTVRLTADLASGTATVQINGKEAAYDVPFAEKGASAGQICFETGAETRDSIWIDEIYVSDYIAPDADYPSEPAKLEKGANDVMVGMQTCDLWHEGKHFGWDKINRYPSRKPYLGFYDDGSPEVKDWEIKYMVEHGVDYSINCWYRPGSIGTPIKEPRNGYSIHDGYFNARYKNKLKFAIAWENGGFNPNDTTAAMNDFKNNILPFWMEYYFKDPNYLVIDNKIVVNIYNLTTLINAFGESGARECIEYMRSEVRAAGFDGVYLIGTTSSSTASVLQQYKDYGYDAVYCYSYGNYGYSVAAQKTYISAQKNQNIISYIPTVAMGRDDSAWNRAQGGCITPEALEELCTWVKDTYFPNGAQGTELGNRMISIDNWNEYGEGHFFMPSALAGFGYMEAVGKVFGQPEHDDIRPADTARLGRLYDQNRELEAREENHMIGDFEPEPLLRYEFSESGSENQLEFTKQTSGGGCGGSATVYYTTFEASGGVLKVTTSSTNKDPMFYTPNGLGLELNGKEVVHLRLKNYTANTSTKVYFITEEDQTYSESKSVSCYMAPNMEEFEDVYLDMGINSLWRGKTLSQLRFDPFEGTGSVDFELIEVLRYGTAEQTEPEFSAELAGVRDENNNDIGEIADGDQVNAKAVIRVENPDKVFDCIPFVAEYDAVTGQFVSVSISQTNRIMLGTQNIGIQFTMRGGRKYKVGLWDADMRPLMKSVDIFK